MGSVLVLVDIVRWLTDPDEEVRFSSPAPEAGAVRSRLGSIPRQLRLRDVQGKLC